MVQAESGTGAPCRPTSTRSAPCPLTPSFLLKNDHKEIRKAFRELLTVHTYIENGVMHPRVRELLPDLEDVVRESREEHHVTDVLVVELSMTKPDDGALRRQDRGPHRERRPQHRRGGGGGSTPSSPDAHHAFEGFDSRPRRSTVRSRY